MSIQAGSQLAAGSIMAANAGSGTEATTAVGETDMTRLNEVSVLTQDLAQITIAVADAALKDLDKVRADLGSVQNQMNVTIANVSTTRVNVQSAESAIREVDFAEESSNFTRIQILMQASTFAMAQANASAQQVLSLLQ
jgi:flagellin